MWKRKEVEDGLRARKEKKRKKRRECVLGTKTF